MEGVCGMEMGERLTVVGRSPLAYSRARAVLRVEDYRRAKAFYSEVLGLQVDDEPGANRSGLVLAGDGTMFELYEWRGVPPSRNSVLAFHAQDFEATIADLRARGIAFEEYDIPELGLKTADGVARVGGGKAVWFKDTEGNILSVETI